jgi:hypothetical protein
MAGVAKRIAEFLSMTAGSREIAKALMLLILFSSGCGTSMAADQTLAASRLPRDVRAFMERRDECDHFRGEDSPDADRRAEISLELQRLCTGSDAELARLKRTYAKNKSVQRSLDGYEINIETGN